MTEPCRILVGDCRERLRELEDRSVHAIVTSPPYWGLRDYGVAEQLGMEPTPGEFVDALVGVLGEARRVLRDDGTLWLNLGDSAIGAPGGWQGKNGERASRTFTARIDMVKRDAALKPKDLVGIPWRVAFALQAEGWWLRSDIIWAKPNPMPESITDRPTKAHEYLFLLAKSERYHYDAEAISEPAKYPGGPGGPSKFRPGVDHKGGNQGNKAIPGRERRNKRDVWIIPTQPSPEAHFATFPEALVEPCILAGAPPPRHRARSVCRHRHDRRRRAPSRPALRWDRAESNLRRDGAPADRRRRAASESGVRVSRLVLAPVTLAEAKRFVGRHHRHGGKAMPPTWKFGVGIRAGDELVGVLVAGLPKARKLDDGRTLEINRVCTLGTRNACSMLYGAGLRAAEALGYRRVVTYTLASEPGSSLLAVGFRVDSANAGGTGTWEECRGSPSQRDIFGTERLPVGRKTRWVKDIGPRRRVEAA